jgi:hypothetical protein
MVRLSGTRTRATAGMNCRLPICQFPIFRFLSIRFDCLFDFFGTDPGCFLRSLKQRFRPSAKGPLSASVLCWRHCFQDFTVVCASVCSTASCAAACVGLLVLVRPCASRFLPIPSCRSNALIAKFCVFFLLFAAG